MPALDFKEIASAASGGGRDQFELFAREFLVMLGLSAVVGPDRGPDAGRDLIVNELRTGVTGETRIRWLVSCKHKAHSGAAVNADDESDIRDRLQTHKCEGFLGFYSTIPSSGLAAKLNASDLPFEIQVFDPEKIERLLLGSAQGMELAKRFFPVSLERWKRNHPSAAKLFREAPHLICACCGTSLLTPKAHGIVVVWTTRSEQDGETQKQVENLYWCCKGTCDRILNGRHRRKGAIDGWEDIADLLIPLTYIRWVMGVLNKLHHGDKFTDEAIENAKGLLLNLFPLVARELTSEETDRISKLSVVPSFLGGWDYDP